MSEDRTRATEIRVGLFVLVALVLGAVIVFSIGGQKQLFAGTRTYRVYFRSVGGLRSGSPVRIAGIDVGTVGAVVLRSDGRTVADIRIERNYAPLIRTGDVATVGSKGLLGDKLIDIEVGSGEAIPEWGAIPTREATDFGALTQQAGAAIEDARATVQNLRSATAVLAEESFQRDVASATRDLAELLRLASREDGTIRRLLADPTLADRVERTVANVEVTSSEVARASRSVRAIADEVRSGNGSAHSLIYGPELRDLARNLARTTGETASMLEAVRTGDGTLHDLIFEDSAGGIITNTEAMTADFRAIVADIRAGRGTIGGLLSDPTIYEDIKRLVGNLERNEILRALVRHSITAEERRATPRPEPSSP